MSEECFLSVSADDRTSSRHQRGDSTGISPHCVSGENHEGNYYFLKPDKEEKDFSTTDKYFKTWCRWSQKTVEDWYEWEVLTDVWLKWPIEWPSPWFLILLLGCRMESEWKRIHPQNLSNGKFIHEFYLANLTSQNSQKVIVLYLRKKLYILQSFTGLIGRSKVGHILKWFDGKSMWTAIEDIAKRGKNFPFTFYWWFNQNFLQILCRAIFDSIVAFYFISIHLHKLQSHFWLIWFDSFCNILLE